MQLNTKIQIQITEVVFNTNSTIIIEGEYEVSLRLSNQQPHAIYVKYSRLQL